MYRKIQITFRCSYVFSLKMKSATSGGTVKVEIYGNPFRELTENDDVFVTKTRGNKFPKEK